MTKYLEKQCFQGDMMIERIASLPSGLRLEPAENGRFILTHSETGHHHSVKVADGVTFYANDNDKFTAYLVVDNTKCLVEHERSFDTHETIGLKDGIYRIRRQREYTAEGFRKAQD